MLTASGAVNTYANILLKEIEKLLGCDALTISGPMAYPLAGLVRDAVEALRDGTEGAERNKKLAVILTTYGGLAEATERMVAAIRHHYEEVVFVIPDLAMSAGTIFVMSGDDIMMDYYSVLGPIDPQVVREGRFVPALAYLTQYERLIQKSKDGELSLVEMALVDKLDLAELEAFTQAREHSTTLLVDWLARYKFKNWTKSETQGKDIDQQTRQERAKEIAIKLSKHDHWHSHGRGITMETLRRELNLRITDFGADEKLANAIHTYHGLVASHMDRERQSYFVHTRCSLQGG